MLSKRGSMSWVSMFWDLVGVDGAVGILSEFACPSTVDGLFCTLCIKGITTSAIPTIGRELLAWFPDGPEAIFSGGIALGLIGWSPVVRNAERIFDGVNVFSYSSLIIDKNASFVISRPVLCSYSCLALS